jgi:hypothetical protein
MRNLHGKNYYKTVVRNLRLIVKCGICGHRQKLQFHHIKETKLNGEGRGSNHRYYDIVKHPEAYIPLCFFCHQKVTSEEIIIMNDTDANIPMWWFTDENNVGEIHVI